MVDRARDGVVTDYLHTGWWPTFNLADTFLITGFIVIALLHARPRTCCRRRWRADEGQPGVPDQQGEPMTTDTAALTRRGLRLAWLLVI